MRTIAIVITLIYCIRRIQPRAASSLANSDEMRLRKSASAPARSAVSRPGRIDLSMTVSRSRCNPISCSRLLGCPGHARPMRVPSLVPHVRPHLGQGHDAAFLVQPDLDSQSSHESRSVAEQLWPSLVTARRHTAIRQVETPLRGIVHNQGESSTHWARPPVAARAPFSANRDVPMN